MILDWDKLRLFYEVCQDLNISKAAERVFLSPSALSRHITNFEKRFGFTLFLRTKSGLQLTEKGEILYVVAEKMALAASSIPFLMQEKPQDPSGTIRINTSVTLASMWLPYYIPGFVENHPDIKLRLKGTDDKIDFIKEDVDVAIATKLPHQKELIQDYLLTFHLGLYASPSYLEKFGTPRNIHDLKDHHLISHDKDMVHQFGNDINNILHPLTGQKPLVDSFLEINMGTSLVTVASMGLGIISLSNEYPGLEQSGLVRILPDIENEVDVYYIYPNYMRTSKKIKTLGSYLKNAVQIK